MQNFKKTIVKILFLSVFFCVFTFSSCKDKYEDCTDKDYAKCNTERPKNGIAKINLTINEENPKVAFTIFEGNFEENNILFNDSTEKDKINILLDAGKYYSFTAVYLKNNDTIIALDGKEMKVSSYRMCELRCYYVDDLNIDLKID